MIFVTGLGGLASYWARQVERLAASFTCVTFDQPGLGQSSDSGAPWNTVGWAEDVLALADRLGAERFALVGHSTGGAIAQHVAAMAPQRVSALVLSGTWAYPDERFLRIFRLRKQILEQLGAASYSELGTLLTQPLEWTAQSADTSPVPLPKRAAKDVVLRRIDALMAHDGRDACRAIQSPALVCAAEDNLLIPLNHAKQLAALIPRASLETTGYGGHHFPQTRADWFNDRLHTFL